MKTLILGGTQFVGVHFTDELRKRGHEVVHFHRGKTHASPAGVRWIQGDRRKDLARAGAESWDCIIDTSAYVPADVQAAARAFAGHQGLYLFISTISVYQISGALDESSPLQTLNDPNTENVTAETYGGLKVLCEQEVLKSFSKALIVRPGLIVGPHDPTNRFDRWVETANSQSTVKIPAPPEHPLQLIDARDLAAWSVAAAERSLTGTFNLAGPRQTLAEVWSLLADVVQHPIQVQWNQGDTHPFILPDQQAWSIFQVGCEKARREGLRHRPLQETVKDIIASRD